MKSFLHSRSNIQYYYTEVHHASMISLSTNQVYLPIAQWLMDPKFG